EIRRDRLADGGFIWIRLIAQKRGQRHQDTWCAESALQSVRLTKRLLQRVQLAVRTTETLDRAHLVAVRLRRKHDARSRRFAITQNRARAADTVLAADVRTREPKIL